MLDPTRPKETPEESLGESLRKSPGTSSGLASGSFQVRIGLAAGLSAFILWGGLPLYWKLLNGVSILEVLAHRIIWAFPACLLVMVVMGRARELLQLFRLRLFVGVLLASLFISLNWGIFLYGVQSGHVLHTSFGYLLQPLVSVFFGLVFFGEKLHDVQKVAIIFAVCACLQFTVGGHLNGIVIGLSTSFAVYGAIRKALGVESLLGITGETLFLIPPAVGVLWYVGSQQSLAFGGEKTWLLVLAGPLTALPLFLFSVAVLRIPLGKLGMIAYLGPTIMAAMAYFLFDERLERQELLGFVMTLAALTLYLGPRRIWHPVGSKVHPSNTR